MRRENERALFQQASSLLYDVLKEQATGGTKIEVRFWEEEPSPAECPRVPGIKPYYFNLRMEIRVSWEAR